MSEPEETIDRVIAEFLQAEEAGQAADRAGLPARHPHLAERLSLPHRGIEAKAAAG